MDVNVYVKGINQKTKDIGLRWAFATLVFAVSVEFFELKLRIKELDKKVKELKPEE